MRLFHVLQPVASCLVVARTREVPGGLRATLFKLSTAVCDTCNDGDESKSYDKALQFQLTVWQSHGDQDNRDLTSHQNERPINDVVLELQQKMEIEKIDMQTSLRYIDINRSCSALPC